MGAERSSDTGTGDVRVVTVDDPTDLSLEAVDGITLVEAEASRWVENPDRADCLLCPFDGSGAVRDVLDDAREVGLAVVAVVEDDQTARAALEAGATEIYREREDSAPAVLARRIRAAGAAIDDLTATTGRRRDFETLVETIPSGAWVLDADCTVLAVNEQLLSKTGHEVGDVVDDHVSTLVDPDDAASIAAAIPDADGTDPVRVDLRTTDGDRVPSEVSIRSLYGDDAGRTVGLVRDLHAGSDRERRLRRLVMATRQLMTADSCAGVMETATATAEDVGFGRATFCRHDDRSQTLERVASGGEAVSDRSTFPVRGMPQGRALHTGSLVVEDEGGESRVHVPVARHGVLSLDPPEGEFGDTDRRLAQLLAASTRAGLERADRQERLLQYEAVVERATEMVYALDEADRFTLVSDSLADHFGYDPAELMGERVSEILVGEDYDSIAPLTGTLQRADSTGKAFEVTAVAADGDRIPVELTASLLGAPDGGIRGTVGAIRDISELERAREQLSDERDRFTYLFENLPDAVAEVEFVDREGILRSVNDRFEATFGHGGDSLLGENIDDYVLPPEVREEGKRINERAADGEVITSNVRRLTVDGTRHFLLRVVPYEHSDGGTRSFAIYTDVTDQKQRERYLRVVNRILRHNLRNDLNLVQGYAEHLVEDLDDATLSEYAQRIYDTVDRITVQSETAREVQDTIRNGDHSLVSVDLVETVESVVDRYAEEYPEADVSASTPPSALIEAGDKVSLVVENLVENAIVHNVGEDTRVRVSLSSDEGWAVLTVEDDGPGIPDAERAVVAEDREITQLEHGSGLGLWIVKWVVENYGGRVEFGSSEFGGAAVRVRFHRSETD